MVFAGQEFNDDRTGVRDGNNGAYRREGRTKRSERKDFELMSFNSFALG